jgi:hypothetical protein
VAASAAVPYNPLGLTVTENDTGVAVEGMGLTDDTLQTAYQAGLASIPHDRWANAPDTGAVLTVDGDQDDFTFTAAYLGDRAVGQIRMYTEHQTNWKRFYDFDLYYSMQAAPATFIKFLTITRQTDVIKGVEIVIDDFYGQIDDLYTLRMVTRGGINPSGGLPDQTYWSEIDVVLVESGPDCSGLQPGDINGDLTVNLIDFSMLASNWQETDPSVFGCADLGGNGQVDLEDVRILASNWLTVYSNLVTVTASSQSPQQFDLVTLDIGVSSAYTDPYNSSDIAVDAVIEAPDQTQITVPCFYQSGSSGNSQWQGRFTPRQQGPYTVQIKVYADNVLDGISESIDVTVAGSSGDGFLTVNTPGSYYSFIHDSGKRFRGIGENIGWEGEGGYSFDDLFPLLNAENANFVRMWLISPKNPGAGLEWNTLGNYDSAAATRLDQVVTLAETNGIYLMLSIDHHNLFMNSADWPDNPYNAANGGPCASPADFFTNGTAKDYYKRKLRYLVARWGYSPYLGVWEFWNEVDHVIANEGVSVSNVANWHNEMSAYLKSIDPYDHIVTTSLSHNDYSQLWNLPDIDFSQRHLYGATSSLYTTITSYESNYSKPFVSGEFSIDWQGPWLGLYTPAQYEEELHLGLWRGMFSPTPILPLTWWWDWHEGWGDYFHFGYASAFMAHMTANDADTLQLLTVSTSPNVEEMGLQSGLDRFIWIRNNSGSGTAVTLTLTGLINGTYQVNYYDPWTGIYTAPEQVDVTDGTLQSTSSVLSSDQDIACWIQESAPPDQTPYPEGIAHPVPGRLEFEDYDYGGQDVAYFDTILQNSYGQYRFDDVEILSSQDTDTGYAVFAEASEWLEYTCDILPGTYTMTVRSSSPQTAQTLTFSLDGQTLTTFSLPATGGFNNWQDTTISGITIPDGSDRIVRFTLDSSSAMLNYVDFVQE